MLLPGESFTTWQRGQAIRLLLPVPFRVGC